MGSKKAKTPKPPPVTPPLTRPEDESIQEQGNNMIRRLYLRRGRNAQKMDNNLSTRTGI